MCVECIETVIAVGWRLSFLYGGCVCVRWGICGGIQNEKFLCSLNESGKNWMRTKGILLYYLWTSKILFIDAVRKRSYLSHFSELYRKALRKNVPFFSFPFLLYATFSVSCTEWLLIWFRCLPYLIIEIHVPFAFLSKLIGKTVGLSPI